MFRQLTILSFFFIENDAFGNELDSKLGREPD